jgi:hypothetical protein
VVQARAPLPAPIRGRGRAVRSAGKVHAGAGEHRLRVPCGTCGKAGGIEVSLLGLLAHAGRFVKRGAGRIQRMSTFPTRDLFGVSVPPLSMDEDSGWRCGVSCVPVVRPPRGDQRRKVVLMSDQRSCGRLPSGTATWSAMPAQSSCGLHDIRRPLPERVAGISSYGAALGRSEQLAWPVFFLGARLEVLLTSRRVRRPFPGIVVAGRHHGYFQAMRLWRKTFAARGRADLRRHASRARSTSSPTVLRLRFPCSHGRGVGVSTVVARGARGGHTWWIRSAPGRSGSIRFLQEPRRMWRR